MTTSSSQRGKNDSRRRRPRRTFHSTFVIVVVTPLLACLAIAQTANGFSATPPSSGGGGSNNNSNNNNKVGIALDRFQVTCPVDKSAIQQFDPNFDFNLGFRNGSGKDDDDDDDNDSSSDQSTLIFAAVYRSNQNQPSVLIRDEFFHAMNMATTTSSTSDENNSTNDNNGNNNDNDNNSIAANIKNDGGVTNLSSEDTNNWAEKLQIPQSKQKPVAIARLWQSSENENYSSSSSSSSRSRQKSKTTATTTTWMLDSLRCALKKEDTDANCDGGSEFLEALGVAIDSLLLHYLQSQQTSFLSSDSLFFFDGVIRTKATLFSQSLLVERGFQEVQTLSRDMATHVSSLDGCIESYARRSIDPQLSPAAKDRALQIVSLLSTTRSDGLIDDEGTVQSKEGNDNNDDDDTGFDPWAGVKMQL